MWILGGLRCLVNHGIGVVNAVTVSAAMLAENIEHIVIVLPVGPITLKLEHRGNRCHGNHSGLHATTNGRIVSKLRCRPAGIFDNVDVVSLGEHVEHPPGNAHLGL